MNDSRTPSSNATHPHETVLRSALDAIERGDRDALGRFMAADVVVHFPGRSPLAGDHHGIGALNRRVIELCGRGFEIDVRDVLASDRHAVGIYRMHAHRDGRNVEWNHVNVYRIENGTIVEVWQNPAEQDIVDDFFADL
jgi:uncharacterized protein